MATNQDKDLMFKGVLFIAGYFVVVKPLLEKLGLAKSSDDKAADELETSSTSPFSPNYYKQMIKKYSTIHVFTFSVFQKHVETIRNAVSGIYYFDDDEEAVYSVFRAMQAKTDVSRLSEVYTQTTGKDLFGWLKSQLSASELAVITKVVNGLPAYR